MDIGKRIREARRAAGISQIELADKAGVNRTYLSQLENGYSSPTLDKLEKIAAAIGCNTADLVEAATEEGAEAGRIWRRVDEGMEGEMYPGLHEFLEDERTRILMSPTDEEISALRGIRFIDRFTPSKQFFIEALLDFRRAHGE